MSYISAIGTANPSNRFQQRDIAEFMIKAMQLDDQNGRRLKTIFNASGIEHRHSVIDDYGRTGEYQFYPNSPDFEPFPTTLQRSALFRTHAIELSVAAVSDLFNYIDDPNAASITHLIVVSCTGLYAPGLDIDLVQRLGLSPSVQRTAINFMGCHAAFNALKIADAFCSLQRDARVLIVCTELCSIHFQKQATADNMLANALFADGAAAVLVDAVPRSPRRLATQLFNSMLLNSGDKDMAWSVGNFGFEMKLSSYVPSLIRSSIGALTSTLMEQAGAAFSDVHLFAIHPGGKRILEYIELELGISRDLNSVAYDVLANYGNMSSPTVLFVLRRLMDTLTTAHNGEPVLSFAFGPGLTLESMLLSVQID